MPRPGEHGLGQDGAADELPGLHDSVEDGFARTIEVKHIAQVLQDSYEAGERQAGEPIR